MRAAEGARSANSLTGKEFSSCFVVVVGQPDRFFCPVLQDLPCWRPAPTRGSGRTALYDEEWQAIAQRLALSDIELRVVKGVLDDWDNEKIAEKNDITTNTVHSHLDRVYKRLGVGSRAGLVERVFREHLNTPR
jgi:DNA-binding CsgD family transcriptional regulator